MAAPGAKFINFGSSKWKLKYFFSTILSNIIVSWDVVLLNQNSTNNFVILNMVDARKSKLDSQNDLKTLCDNLKQ